MYLRRLRYTDNLTEEVWRNNKKAAKIFDFIGFLRKAGCRCFGTLYSSAKRDLPLVNGKEVQGFYPDKQTLYFQSEHPMVPLLDTVRVSDHVGFTPLVD